MYTFHNTFCIYSKVTIRVAILSLSRLHETLHVILCSNGILFYRLKARLVKLVHTRFGKWVLKSHNSGNP